MNIFLNYRIFGLIILSFFGVIIFTLAGSLEPNSPTPDLSYETLGSIYAKISPVVVSKAAASGHSFGPSNSPIPTFNTLESIWNSIVWKTMNNSGTIDAGLYATTSLAVVEPNLIASNIKASTTIFGIEGSMLCPVELQTLDLASAFPHINTSVCPTPEGVRTVTVGPFDVDVKIKVKTDISIDDYLKINGQVIAPTQMYGYCGANRIISAGPIIAGTVLMTVPANTPIQISDVDTIGVGASGAGILSFWTVVN